ncbi:hypothetical protein ElyMa_003609800 [Elysia marginata]|uniref:Uncharacterized protein n=1 Tax=Elysia marginata TaxID=1093978 RepID=A0AAV4ETY6_9GAST|nr:hypothetical protein ElyMa_003609800 [Elysia marginata]
MNRKQTAQVDGESIPVDHQLPFQRLSQQQEASLQTATIFSNLSSEVTNLHYLTDMDSYGTLNLLLILYIMEHGKVLAYHVASNTPRSLRSVEAATNII